jgi:hypothetical protein
MAYSQDKNIGGLDTLATATLADGDLIVVGDVSDSNRAKAIPVNNIFPSSSTDNAIARFDSTTGKLLQNSGITITDLSGDNYGIYPPNETSGNGKNVFLRGSAPGTDANGGYGMVKGANGNGTGTGGPGYLYGGDGGATGAGGAAIVQGGAGGATSGKGGDIYILGGAGTNGNANGGIVVIQPGAKNGSGTNGTINLYPYVGAPDAAILNLDSIASSSKTFTFPNESGTLAVGTPWTTWTPTLVNLTLGDGSLTARYTQIGKTVFFNIVFILGSTSSVAANSTISLPVTASSSINANTAIGSSLLKDANVGEYIGLTRFLSTTTIRPVTLQGNVAFVTAASISDTSPFTWTNTDRMVITGTYEAA